MRNGSFQLKRAKYSINHLSFLTNIFKHLRTDLTCKILIQPVW